MVVVVLLLMMMLLALPGELDLTEKRVLATRRRMLQLLYTEVGNMLGQVWVEVFSLEMLVISMIGIVLLQLLVLELLLVLLLLRIVDVDEAIVVVSRGEVCTVAAAATAICGSRVFWSGHGR